jgi:hypothetical protein
LQAKENQTLKRNQIFATGLNFGLPAIFFFPSFDARFLFRRHSETEHSHNDDEANETEDDDDDDGDGHPNPIHPSRPRRLDACRGGGSRREKERADAGPVARTRPTGGGRAQPARRGGKTYDDDGGGGGGGNNNNTTKERGSDELGR